ncbi:TspO/MBR family protein [Allobranchiibius sp. GilTou38]|uniref:TspO/MBR family protein n=1 Tax=Allobranchiibius sp. GilTou38 TaxID=2815210 RepID=UPI001AA18A61|nr:TspO/MBR family protein [Allobranchiibius sp. GilTou38]MBO1766624.1 tryptophan-rich sensory protein [Allobranchiibius sp. GilTou38]
MDLRRVLFAAAPPVAAAVIGGLGSREAPTTYARLDRPSWAPPAQAFGPAWSVLYATIGAAGWRMYPRVSRTTRLLHLAQLTANGAWPVVFFGVQDKRASLAVIATLDALMAAELWSLRRTDPGSAAILVPYAAWIAFATALNAAVSDPGA